MLTKKPIPPLWTAEEDALIIEHYPALGGAAMADMLPGRAPNSIQVRACKLGVKNKRNADAMKWFKWPPDTMAPVWRAWDGAAVPMGRSW